METTDQPKETCKNSRAYMHVTLSWLFEHASWIIALVAWARDGNKVALMCLGVSGGPANGRTRSCSVVRKLHSGCATLCRRIYEEWACPMAATGVCYDVVHGTTSWTTWHEQHEMNNMIYSPHALMFAEFVESWHDVTAQKSTKIYFNMSPTEQFFSQFVILSKMSSKSTFV